MPRFDLAQSHYQAANDWLKKYNALFWAQGMVLAASQLLDTCNAARRQGADFPTIWWQIIEPNPMVAGLPVQQLDDDQPVLDIPLLTGQRLRFGRDSFTLT